MLGVRADPPQALFPPTADVRRRAFVGGGEREQGSRAGLLCAATRVMTLLTSVSVVLLKARWPAVCPLLAPARVVQPARQAMMEAASVLNFLLPAAAPTSRRQ